MSRAQQFEIFAAGAMYNGSILSSGYAKFYAAGTTTAKNAYSDVAKATAVISKALDAQGRADVFGDGIYKILLYEGDPDDGGTLRDTIDNYKCTAVLGDTSTKTAAYTVDRDDDVVLVNTVGGNITISIADVDTFDNPVTIKKIHADNTVTVNPYSTQTIDGNLTVAMTENNETMVLYPDTSADVWRRGDPLAGVTASNDELNIMDGVTATYLELNQADNAWATVSTVDTPASGTCSVACTFKDAAGTTMATAVAGMFYMSTSATGLTIDSPNTSITNVGNGDLISSDGGGEALWLYVTTAAGLLEVTITATNGTYYLVFLHPSGKLVISDACVVNA